jgi:chromosomal replication initiator protein
MYLTRELTGMSLPEIGLAFGNKHHTTVLYSITKVAKQMQENSEYQSLIQSYQLALN